MNACRKRKRRLPPPSACSRELTTALADLTAKRNQLEAGVRTHRDRLARLDQEIANVAGRRAEARAGNRQSRRHRRARGRHGDRAGNAGGIRSRGAGQREPATSPRGRSSKPPARRSPRPTSACSGSRPKRAPFQSSSTARPRICGRRSSTASPSPRAMKRRSAPCSATISTRRSIPPRRCAGPMPARPSTIRRCRPASKPLAAHVEAPSELARRLAQIGVVAKERGAELVSQLKTGQRLVSLEGDVWRWDGFVAAAHAPTGAARRLAERARLVDIEHELEQARTDAAAKRQALEDAEAELKVASARRSPPPARPGAPRSARPMPRANAMPRPSARSTATPRANRR